MYCIPLVIPFISDWHFRIGTQIVIVEISDQNLLKIGPKTVLLRFKKVLAAGICFDFHLQVKNMQVGGGTPFLGRIP